MPKLSKNIIEAIKNNNISELQSIISNNNVNDSDNGSWSSLMWAANEGHIEVVELLLDKGANVHHSDIGPFCVVFV